MNSQNTKIAKINSQSNGNNIVGLIFLNSQNTKIAKISSQSNGNNIVGKQSKHQKNSKDQQSITWE